eukprot:gnl/MRDRNA2_/MRDRNA2_49531_c0_seq1.p1 gnl/MRDRNA2_/MRDRNA2_49531_c0~~gnl/MRDRNA2_/MRDRNA2_49531_c0_seq1.p1  ORF type:complete len:309 (+),score=70.89 gnl/MRDRNA2_/MRDRNA2_49531_c0_seq1:38-964(+)
MLSCCCSAEAVSNLVIAEQSVEMASEIDEKLWAAVAALRQKGPLVQCLTNFVSMDIMANGLLAIGASPAMVHATGELKDAVPIVGAIGGAVSINIGTLDDRWIESFKETVQICKEKNVPWVLDPVAAGFTPLRTDTAVSLMDIHPPAVVRGNGSEIGALSAAACKSGEAEGGKGVDSTESSDAALDAAKRLASKYKCVVCVSGAVDYIVGADGEVGTCPHGVEMLTKVTAAGCLISSIIAAFVASKPENISVHEVTTIAMTYYGLCAEKALKASTGPGSFRVALMDMLYNVKDKESCTDIPVKSVMKT